MKAEHRHELKTNALAEWLANSPDWAKENLLSIVVVVVTILAVGGFFFWRSLSRSATYEEQYRFTGIVNQISNYKMRILGSRGQEMGASADLFIPANSLGAFANSTDDNNLGALALIKQAEALRSQLHYRADSVSQADLAAQIAKAKQSYTKALEKASDNISLAAAAKFGLGLCEEELGNFDEAKKIYSEIAKDSAFEGTVSVKQAELRLATMADFQADVAFMPKPKPKPQPMKIEPVTIDMRPSDPNKSAATQPKVTLGPVNTNAPAVIKPVTVEPKATATKPEIKIAPVESETKSETPADTVAPPDSKSTPKATEPNASSS